MGFFGKLAGAFGFGTARAAPNTQPIGSDGVQAYAGYLASTEQNTKLAGRQRWTTYANMVANNATIATGTRLRCDLLGGTKWTAIPNKRGGPNADRGVEIVTQGLLEAQMPTPWTVAVRKQSLSEIYGFALHEWVIKRRDDGMIVFADLQHRPQHTIDRWSKPSGQAGWDAVGQQTREGDNPVIPRNRLWYSVDNTLTESPEGMGLLRHVVQLAEQVAVLEAIEGFAFETDLRGTPVARAPFGDLYADELIKAGGDKDKAKAAVRERTEVVRGFLQNLIKTPEKLQYLYLDSGTYRGSDPNTISQVQKWAIELLRGDARGLAEIDTVIRRKQLEMARVFSIEFVLMGGDGSGSGSLAQHADKTSLLAQSLASSLSDLSADATRDLARPLVALNGLDPDTCTPTLQAEPISMDAVLSVCQALASLAASGLPQGSPQRNEILERLHLAPEDPPDPAIAGMLGMARRGVAGRLEAASGGDPSNPEAEDTDTPPAGLDEEPTEKRRRWRGGKQFSDSDHPRDKGGKFAPSEGGGSDASSDDGETALESVEMAPNLDKIYPWNEAFDTDRVDSLAEDMKKRGWVGRPLVAVKNADGVSYRTLTGSHRLTAAAQAGLTKIPFVIVNMPQGWKSRWDGLYRDGRKISDASKAVDLMEEDGVEKDVVALIRED